MSEPDFQAIAAQLRHPEGAKGIETAARMSDNNKNMILRCIEELQCRPNETVLECGPGGGSHLPFLLDQAEGLHYHGVDISETMIQLAKEQNQVIVETGIAAFHLVTLQAGVSHFPFEASSFDKIFTVNTLYFWDNPMAQAIEFLRVLKPGGRFCVAFALSHSMEKLPFTQYGFTLYDPVKAELLLQEAGFTGIATLLEEEPATLLNGTEWIREIALLSATKA